MVIFREYTTIYDDDFDKFIIIIIHCML